MKKFILSLFLVLTVFSVSAQISEETFFSLCATGAIDDVQRAVAAGANVNGWGEIRDSSGVTNFYTCLMIACKNENIEVVDFLLDHGARPNMHSREYPIHYVTSWQLAGRANTKRIIEKLHTNGADIDARTTSGLTPLLICAADQTKEDLGLLFIDLGADINVRDANANTPLMIALNSGINSELQHLLLDKLIVLGANTNAKNNLGDTAFSILKKYDKRKSDEVTYYSWYWKIQDNYYNARY
jgi:ankyrin repeat protein